MKEIIATILAIFFAPCLLSQDLPKVFKYFVDEDKVGEQGFVPPLNSAFMVRYHNKVRRELGASNMMEVRWEPTLAENAAKWVAKCNCANKPWYTRLNITQNTEFATNVKFENFLKDALFHWNIEKEQFDEKTGKCKLETGDCDHFKTMAQWNLMYVGCAAGYCGILETSHGPYSGAVFLTCEYHTVIPNTQTQPYLTGTPCEKCPTDYSICRAGLCYGINKRYKEWTALEDEASFKGPSVIILSLSTLAALLY